MSASKTIELGMDKKVSATISNVGRITIEGAPAVRFTVMVEGNILHSYELLRTGSNTEVSCAATTTGYNSLIVFLRDVIGYDTKQYMRSGKVLNAVDDILSEIEK